MRILLLSILTIVWVAGTTRAADPAIPGVAVSSSIADINELDMPVQMVEQEFDPALLENLVAPTTAPAQVRLPPAYLGKNEWKGSLCGINKPAHVVIRKPSDWDVFWDMAIKPYLSRPINTPPVDFNKDMVIGVFGGGSAVPGDIIEIRSIKPAADGTLLVVFRNTSQMQPVFMPPFPVQPFHLQKTPLFPGKTIFKRLSH